MKHCASYFLLLLPHLLTDTSRWLPVAFTSLNLHEAQALGLEVQKDPRTGEGEEGVHAGPNRLF